MKRIALHGKYGEGKFALVDDEDFDRYSGRSWYVTTGQWPYAVSSNGHARLIYLHKIIVDAYPHQRVDHINGDTFDNRRDNLRLCSNAENCRNQSRRSDCMSGFKGVSWQADRKSWRCQIMMDYQKINLGNYSDREEAAYVYDQAALQLFGEFARTNLL